MQLGDMILRKCVMCGAERIGILGSRLHGKVVNGELAKGKLTDSLYDPHCECAGNTYTMKRYRYGDGSLTIVEPDTTGVQQARSESGAG